KWVIQNIESQDEIRRPSDGARIRSFQRIELLEYVAPDVMKAPPSPAKAAQETQANKPAGSAASGTSKTYTVKKGDTLWAIATRLLGSGAKWTELASTNNIRDPKRLQIGTVLRIP
ncbi:MAG: LysM peptidoglycan-binding domain-containing protein, partial [Intrasporangiaceae bacterium]|nr:LysM peptidoglycan-binding domain-containing protein [Intrasporangiaceae bacterium]